jgi:hypothetical protein
MCAGETGASGGAFEARPTNIDRSHLSSVRPLRLCETLLVSRCASGMPRVLCTAPTPLPGCRGTDDRPTRRACASVPPHGRTHCYVRMMFSLFSCRPVLRCLRRQRPPQQRAAAASPPRMPAAPHDVRSGDRASVHPSAATAQHRVLDAPCGSAPLVRTSAPPAPLFPRSLCPSCLMQNRGKTSIRSICSRRRQPKSRSEAEARFRPARYTMYHHRSSTAASSSHSGTCQEQHEERRGSGGNRRCRRCRRSRWLSTRRRQDWWQRRRQRRRRRR